MPRLPHCKRIAAVSEMTCNHGLVANGAGPHPPPTGGARASSVPSATEVGIDRLLPGFASAMSRPACGPVSAARPAPPHAAPRPHSKHSRSAAQPSCANFSANDAIPRCEIRSRRSGRCRLSVAMTSSSGVFKKRAKQQDSPPRYNALMQRRFRVGATVQSDSISSPDARHPIHP